MIGYTPGAVSDLAARTIGEGLHQAWGQPVIVDNRPGSGGNIGAGFVARAAPDGYTLMVGTDAQMSSNVHLYKHVGYDPVKDFAPVAYAGANIICLAVNAQLPINSVADVIAYAKQNPGKLAYGTSGVGSPHHLAGELLRQKTGIDIQHVPYRGGGAAVNDLLGGHIGMAFLSLSAAVPHINTGKIKIIAMVEKTRYAAMPDIPTIGETVPGFEMSSWLGIFAPAGTPADVIAKLNDGIAKVLTVDGREGEARQSRPGGRGGKARGAGERRQGRPEGARRAGEGRRHPAGVDGQRVETLSATGRGGAAGGPRAAPARAARGRREELRAHPEELSRPVRRAASARAAEAAERQGRRGAAADHGGAAASIRRRPMR